MTLASKQQSTDSRLCDNRIVVLDDVTFCCGCCYQMPYSQAYVLVCATYNNIYIAPTQTAMTDTFHEKETMHETNKRPVSWV